MTKAKIQSKLGATANTKATCKVRSPCPIAKTLDLLGDKWTLLVLRDVLVFGAATYSEFAKSAERIPSNLLSDRLTRLVSEGFLEKQSYQTKPPRYKYIATTKGRAIRPIISAMKKFGDDNL
jgi:DNA-binding HxlR family transcriptional regulator